MSFLQQTFDFENSRKSDFKAVPAYIDAEIAHKGRLVFSDVAAHFYDQSTGQTPFDLPEVIFGLFKDGFIQFVFNGNIIAPEQLRASFYEPAPSKTAFINKRKTLSLIKALLSEPDQWTQIEIAKPEVVKPSDLSRAKSMGEKIFGDLGQASQDSLCFNIRKQLRVWKSRLKEFEQISQSKGRIGEVEINKGLECLNELLAVYDPCRFIDRFLSCQDRIYRRFADFKMLTHFFKNRIKTWDMIVRSVKEFEENRKALEAHPVAGKAYKKLEALFHAAEPSDKIDDMIEPVRTVKEVNDRMVEEKVDHAKQSAAKKMDEKIKRLIQLLDRKKADKDLKNKTLFPFQEIKKRIYRASRLSVIDEQLNNGREQYEYVTDILTDF